MCTGGMLSPLIVSGLLLVLLLYVCVCVPRVSKDAAVTPATVQCVMSGAGSKRLCQLLPQGNCGMLVCMCGCGCGCGCGGVGGVGMGLLV